MKKWILGILVVLVALLFSSEAAAAEETSGTWGQLNWSLETDGILYISGEGAMPEGMTPWQDLKDQIIRVEIGEGVTTISNKAFMCCTNLLTVVLPDSVTSIGAWAFYQCEEFGFVLDCYYNQRMPDGVVSIGEYAFAQCPSLFFLKLGDGVVSIGESAFWGCSNLEWVLLSENLEIIGRSAFSECGSLTNMIFPASLQKIEAQAFTNCFIMKNLYFKV